MKKNAIERFDAEGIERGALLPIVSPEIYLPQANEDILEMVEQYPDRFFAFCNIDPRAITNSPEAPLGDLLRHYKDQGCRGIGEVMPNMPLWDPKVQNLLRHAEEVGLPVTTPHRLAARRSHRSGSPGLHRPLPPQCTQGHRCRPEGWTAQFGYQESLEACSVP